MLDVLSWLRFLSFRLLIPGMWQHSGCVLSDLPVARKGVPGGSWQIHHHAHVPKRYLWPAGEKTK